MRKLQIITVLLIAAVLISFSCAPKPPAPSEAPSPGAPPPAVSEWDRIVEAAKKEGVVTMYQGLGSEVATSIREGLMKAYRIKVESAVLSGADVRERIRMEQQAGVPMCDMILSGWGSLVDEVKAGFAQQVTVEFPAAQEKDVWRTHPYQYDPEKRMFALVNKLSVGFIINTDLVKPGEEPTSCYDLLDPKWKGKMVMQDPRIPGPGFGMYAWIPLGEDYWRKMAQQDVYIERSKGRVVDMVVHGEKAAAMFATDWDIVNAINAGAPIKPLHMKEGTATILKGSCLIRGAPHPNASLVFINWLMTREGQIALSKPVGETTIRKDIVEDWVLPAWQYDAPHKLLEPLGADPLYGEKTIAFATKIFGKM